MWRWWRGQRRVPADMIERAVFLPDGARGSQQVGSLEASLEDREEIKRWLRELVGSRGGQVFIDRHWGSLCALFDKREVTTVLLSDGSDSWFAVSPGADRDRPLTPDQVERIVLDALTSVQRPAWPDWIPL